MPELFIAMYRSEPVCIFELLDQNGQYREEVRSEYRRASQSNELLCPECHGILELCAGAIREPYFRHKSVLDCKLMSELGTEAGKRNYYGRKMLYSLIHTAEGEKLFLEEEKKYPYHPVLFTANGAVTAFLYLDGRTRNYKELGEAQKSYEKEGITCYWFLHKKYQSNGRNITSDEAEAGRLNKGILFYLDTKNQKIEIRKAYQSPYGERKYLTKAYPLEQLTVDSSGSFHKAFLKDYEEHVKREKQSLDKVLRLPMEDGIEECYFDFTILYVEFLEEIWVLPQLGMPMEEQEYNEEAKKRREDYVKMLYCEIEGFDEYRRDNMTVELLNLLNRRKLVSNWLN